MFTINGQQFSESSEHFLSKSKCQERGFELTKNLTRNPPFFIDRKGGTFVFSGSNPYYACVPTSMKELKFITTYYEFPGNFTSNLRNSGKFLQVGIGISTQYDDSVIGRVEDHQLTLRSGILMVMSQFSEEDIQGKTGRDALAKAILVELNSILEKLEGFGGIENIYFTSFMLQ